MEQEILNEMAQAIAEDFSIEDLLGDARQELEELTGLPAEVIGDLIQEALNRKRQIYAQLH